MFAGDARAEAVVRILYGGSVTPENIAQFLEREEIDGGLVGGASPEGGGVLRDRRARGGCPGVARAVR